MSEYYAYRIFLNEYISNQEKLFPQTKEESFKSLFEQVQESIRIEFNDWGISHIIFHYKRLSEEIVIWQFARKQDFIKHVPSKERIENISDQQYPYIFIVFHLRFQIALIEKNTSVFQDIDAVKSKLSRFFAERLPNNISVSFNEISEQKEFWERVKEFDMIEEINLEYNPPNFFRGQNAVDKLVKEAHEETNYETFIIYFKNKVTGLKFQYDVFKEHIQRLSSGAGKYIIEGIKEAQDDFDKVNELNNDKN